MPLVSYVVNPVNASDDLNDISIVWCIKLVVEVSSVRSASYKEIIQKIYKKIKAENLSKQEALKLRGELC